MREGPRLVPSVKRRVSGGVCVFFCRRPDSSLESGFLHPHTIAGLNHAIRHLRTAVLSDGDLSTRNLCWDLRRSNAFHGLTGRLRSEDTIKEQETGLACQAPTMTWLFFMVICLGNVRQIAAQKNSR